MIKKISLILLALKALSCFSQEKDSIELKAAEEFVEISQLITNGIIGKTFSCFITPEIDRRTIKNTIFKEKITFVNFWFESCPPCVTEFESLNKLYETYKLKKKFQFYAFTFETKENAQRIQKKYKLNYPILLIPYDSVHILNFGLGFPTNMIIDGRSKVRFILAGGPTNSMVVEKLIERFIRPQLDKLLTE